VKYVEQFPNLSLKVHAGYPEYIFSAWTMERLLEDIQKYCIDRQRLKEAISKSAFIKHLTELQQKELFNML